MEIVISLLCALVVCLTPVIALFLAEEWAETPSDTDPLSFSDAELLEFLASLRRGDGAKTDRE